MLAWQPLWTQGQGGNMVCGLFDFGWLVKKMLTPGFLGWEVGWSRDHSPEMRDKARSYLWGQPDLASCSRPSWLGHLGEVPDLFVPQFPHQLDNPIRGGLNEDKSGPCLAWSSAVVILDNVFFFFPCIFDLLETCPPGPELSAQDRSLGPGFASDWWAQDRGRHAPWRGRFLGDLGKK